MFAQTLSLNPVTTAEIIEEIKRLPLGEQIKVAEFARQVTELRPLNPEELGVRARRMVEANDEREADRLQEEIVRGFYGGGSNA
jgi:predicted metallopeptidase